MSARQQNSRLVRARAVVLLTAGVASALMVGGLGLARADRQRHVAPTALPDRARFSLPLQAKTQAVQRFGLKAMAFRRSFLRRHNTHYSHQVPLERAPHVVRDQMQSGRCWIFGSALVLRSKALNKRGRPTEKLSVSFVNYHALREQAFGMLGYIEREISHGRKPSDDYASENLSEGGWFALASKIIKTHGIVPESAMPSTYDGNNSGITLGRLSATIAAAQRELAKHPGGKATARSKRAEIGERYQKRIVALLQTTLGTPPTEVRVAGRRLSPRDYLRQELGIVDRDLEYVALTHHPGVKSWRTARFSSKGDSLVHQASYVPMSVIEQAVRATIDGGEAVALSTNVSKDNRHRAEGEHLPDAAKGVLSVSAFNYKSFIPEVRLNQHTRLRGSVSPTNHLMAITAYDKTSRGGVRKWKIDNSWGEDVADRGHWHMYGDYFREYVTRVVVPRWAVPAEALRNIEKGVHSDYTTPNATLAREKRWGREEKRQLVLDLLAGDLSEGEAIKAYGVDKGTIRRWKRSALSAAAKALAESGQSPQ